jgi:hypothetical protein
MLHKNNKCAWSHFCVPKCIRDLTLVFNTIIEYILCAFRIFVRFFQNLLIPYSFCLQKKELCGARALKRVSGKIVHKIVMACKKCSHSPHDVTFHEKHCELFIFLDVPLHTWEVVVPCVRKSPFQPSVNEAMPTLARENMGEGSRDTLQTYIIFDALCLFYVNFYSFVYTSWHFYAFSGTNILIRCHSVSSLFSTVLYFKKFVQEIFSKLDEIKAKILYFTVTKTESRGKTKKCQEAATPGLGAAQPLAAPRGGVGPPGAHRPRPSAYKLPLGAKTLN